MYNKDRTPENQREKELEAILCLLNETLKDDEQTLIRKFTKPKYPVLFIVGNARSGTTLLYQWLASTGLFAYPSNIISRFYEAPYLGSLIHKMFVDFDKFGELLGNQSLTFESTLGKTNGPISPHEFWYFWRRFFSFGEIQKLSEEELSGIDVETFVQELAALEGAFNKPLVLKAMILNWNLDFLKEVIPNAIFIHLNREEVFNMHSLFNARIKYFGDVRKWYSFKPPEFPLLRGKSVYEQLAGQVFYTNRAINSCLTSNREDYIKINYEDFCRKPQELLSEIQIKFKNKGYNLEPKYQEGVTFRVQNKVVNRDFEIAKAKKAISKVKITN